MLTLVEAIRHSETKVWKVLFRQAPGLFPQLQTRAIHLHRKGQCDIPLCLLQAILSFIGDCDIIKSTQQLEVLKERGFDWDACLEAVRENAHR
jgi:hypothetical protein